MKKFIKLFAFFALMSISIVACSDDDDDNTTNPAKTMIEAKTVTNIETFKPAQGDTITYFSLRDNKVVAKSEINATNWDIAFRRTSIYVNAPEMGTGNGGAFLMNGIFEDLEAVPNDSVFYTTNTLSVPPIPIGSGKGWYNYDGAKLEITPRPGVFIVIRTADGKYAKLKILSYYKGYPDNIPSDVMQRTDKTYSFKYVYQADGSKSFLK